jgi:hypothetical protein
MSRSSRAQVSILQGSRIYVRAAVALESHVRIHVVVHLSDAKSRNLGVEGEKVVVGAGY